MLVSLTMVASLAFAESAARAQRVQAGDIEQAVRNAVAVRLHTMGSTANVRVAGRVGDQWLPVGQLAIESGEVGGRFPRSRVGVPVQLKIDGRVVRSLTVWMEVRDQRQVLTYAATYGAHAQADGVRLVPAIVDMVCCSGKAITTDDEPLHDARLKRLVRIGQPAMAQDFEAVPDVVALQRVAIDVVRGPVRLQGVGTALRDGHVGDLVEVRTDASNQTVRSRVVAKQRVQIDE